jgi:hypothetical protein
VCDDKAVAEELDGTQELDDARRATERFAGGVNFSVADIDDWLVDATVHSLTAELPYLLGLADRCADLRAKGDSADTLGIPKTREQAPDENLHEAVGQVALEALERHWTSFGQDPRNWARYEEAPDVREHDRQQRRLLAAVLHRMSWALSQSDLPLTHRATDLTRVAKWMETDPHALLSLRCSGLVYSKQNRYVPAWLTFSELRLRLSHYERSYRGRNTDERVIDMFREVQQQALLAETGTAARTVERLLVDWIVHMEGRHERWKRLSYHEAFHTLRRGTFTGGLSSEEVATMHTEERKSVTRAAIPGWKRRPGVMTARCHLELATLALVVGDIGIKAPPGEFDSWEHFSDKQLELFEDYYRQAHSDETIQFDAEHVRELVQLRLHAALLRPLWDLDPVENTDAPPCLRTPTPNRNELAGWLRDTGNNANVVLSISAPEYLAWMQIMSGDDELLDWIESPDQDPLRRDSVQHTVERGRKVRVGDEQDRARVVAGVERAREILMLRERAAAG